MNPRRATLSLCMIARDAETTLGRALSSARPFFDELVVVDTGSMDRTREMAAEQGARVSEFAWCDSFSAARNFSLAQATGDWIFWMDADDVLPAASGRELRRLIDGCPERDAAFWVTVQESRPMPKGAAPRVTAHGHVKLFPRRDDIRFRYRIHEQVAPVIRALGMPIRGSRAVVKHVADRSAAAQAARRERNLRLALLDQAEYPGEAFVLLSLGISHLHRPGDLRAAISYLRQSILAFAPGSQVQSSAYLYLGQALVRAGQRDEAEAAYREALVAFTDDAVLMTRLGELCEAAGRLEEAIDLYRAVLVRGRVRSSAVRLVDNQVRVALRLGNLYLRTRRRGEAERLWREFLTRYPRAVAIERALRASYLRPWSIVV